MRLYVALIKKLAILRFYSVNHYEWLVAAEREITCMAAMWWGCHGAGDRILPHPHQRRCQLSAAAIRLAGQALQSDSAVTDEVSHKHCNGTACVAARDAASQWPFFVMYDAILCNPTRYDTYSSKCGYADLAAAGQLELCLAFTWRLRDGISGPVLLCRE